MLHFIVPACKEHFSNHYLTVIILIHTTVSQFAIVTYPGLSLHIVTIEL